VKGKTNLIFFSLFLRVSVANIIVRMLGGWEVGELKQKMKNLVLICLPCREERLYQGVILWLNFICFFEVFS